MPALPAAKRSRFSFDLERDGVAAGLRAYADLLNANPVVPIGSNLKLSLHTDSKDEARALLAAVGGHWDKREWTSDGKSHLIFEGWLHGIPVDVWVNREEVCERRVVGTREVTEAVPVGEDTRPTETVTRTEEIVEWVCSPLLAGEPREATA